MAFGKLANLASGAVLQKVADQLVPVVHSQLQRLPALGASKLQDEEFFKTFVIQPSWLAVEGSTSGLTKLYPPLESKFAGLMTHLRNELLVFDGELVSVVDDVQERLPAAIVAGLNQS